MIPLTALNITGGQRFAFRIFSARVASRMLPEETYPRNARGRNRVPREFVPSSRQGWHPIFPQEGLKILSLLNKKAGHFENGS
jgi:hypothetical protein